MSALRSLMATTLTISNDTPSAGLSHQGIRLISQSVCSAGLLVVAVLCIILADSSVLFASVRQSVARPGGAGSLGAVAGNPSSTPEEWRSAIGSLVESYRKKSPQSRAPRDLLRAGEAHLTVYRRWRHNEDLESCIRLVGEYIRVERRGPQLVTGLKVLREAHLLKREAERPVPSISIASPSPTRMGLSNRFPPERQPSVKGLVEGNSTSCPNSATSYRYTGNPFCATDHEQPTLPIQYLLPNRSSQTDERQPTVIASSIPRASTAMAGPQPLPEVTTRTPHLKSASVPPASVSDGLPPRLSARPAVRELVIVLDPGHGGKDPGAVSRDGSVKEKDITLEVAKRVKQRLASRNPSFRVELTRSDDRFLALEERTAQANASNADLFISIHCNADIDTSSKGVETFYLSKATSRRAMRVAARENGISLGKMSDLEATLLDLMLTSKKSESDRLASIVHSNLVSTMQTLIPSLRDRGVKPAPFYVLLGAQMPAILVECAFISNNRDKAKLTSPPFLDSVADGITKGAADYLQGLEARK